MKSFQKSLELTLIDKNLPQILKKYGDDLLARQEKEHLDKTHNPEPLTDSQRSEDSSDEKVLKERTAYATGGMGAFRGNPLFSNKPK